MGQPHAQLEIAGNERPLAPIEQSCQSQKGQVPRLDVMGDIPICPDCGTLTEGLRVPVPGSKGLEPRYCEEPPSSCPNGFPRDGDVDRRAQRLQDYRPNQSP